MTHSRDCRFLFALRKTGFIVSLMGLWWPSLLMAERVPGTYPISINAYVDGGLRPCIGVKGERPVYLVDGVEKVASPQAGFWLLSAAEFAPGLVTVDNVQGIIKTIGTGLDGTVTGASRQYGEAQIHSKTIELNMRLTVDRPIEELMIAAATVDAEGRSIFLWKRVRDLTPEKPESFVQLIGPAVFNDSGEALRYALFFFENGAEIRSSRRSLPIIKQLEEVFMERLIAQLAAQIKSPNVPLKLFHRPDKPAFTGDLEGVPERIIAAFKVSPQGFPEELELRTEEGDSFVPISAPLRVWIYDFIASWRFIPTIRQQEAIAGEVTVPLRLLPGPSLSSSPAS